MLYSFNLIKKFLPAVKKDKIVEYLNFHTAEAAKINQNSFEIDLPANRWSDLGSHLGVVKELAAIGNLKFKDDFYPKKGNFPKNNNNGYFQVKVEDKNDCPRYMGLYLEKIRVEKSPNWMKQILNDCGINSINNVVDITNYIMILTGQPLHAFDYDKLSFNGKKPGLIVRRAKKDEKIVTLDGKKIDLDPSILVIADQKEPLAIAGIKGGKKAEIDENTKRIIVESANFRQDLIYKTSRKIGLVTDASLRFSHQLSYILPEIGMLSALKMFKEMAGAKAKQLIDKNYSKRVEKIIAFSNGFFEKLIGFSLPTSKIKDILNSLKFKAKIDKKSKKIIVRIPPERTDIGNEQDLSEEILRIYGLDKIKSQPPHIVLKPSETAEMVVFKDKIRDFLVNLSFSEVYNYSFNDIKKENSLELENPVSSQYRYLRTNLIDGLIVNLENNLKYFKEIKIFEIGKVFEKKKDKKGIEKASEEWRLGLAMVGKGETIYKLKGVINSLLKGMGLVDFLFKYDGSIESDFQKIGWSFKKGDFSLAEINLSKLLEMVNYEISFEPLSLYPSVMRDISVFVSDEQKIGEIIQVIQDTNVKYIEDVDLMDEFYIEGKRSLTFRVVFQAKDRTLTSEEINNFMGQIKEKLSQKLNIKIRSDN